MCHHPLFKMMAPSHSLSPPPPYQGIIVFNGDRVHYNTIFKPTIYLTAEGASPLTPNEILWDILTAAERTAQLPHFTAFALPADHTDNAANAVVAKYEREFYKHTALQVQREVFKQWLHNHISVSVKEYISQVAGTAFRSLSSAEIVLQLNQIYGTALPAVLNRIKQTIEIPYVLGMDINQHIHIFNDCFKFHETQAQPYPDHLKYSTLKKSMISCEEYAKVISSFERSHPTAADQTYARLCELITHHYDYLISNPVGAASNQATSSKQPPTRTTNNSNGNRNGPNKRAKTNNFTTELEPPHSYCFTHGLGFHNGYECKSKRPDHKDDATATDRKGGNTYCAQSRPKRS
jgi:hypothetical protein